MRYAYNCIASFREVNLVDISAQRKQMWVRTGERARGAESKGNTNNRTNEDIFINGTIKMALKQYDSPAVIQKKQQLAQQKWENNNNNVTIRTIAWRTATETKERKQRKKYEYVFL